MIELRHLRYFVAIAEELHFGRAALRLGISQPPLSQQLRALEAELGTPLLERTSRRVRLTEAGRVFLIEARKTIVQSEHATDMVRRVRQGEAGELAIGFTISAPFVTTVARALIRFRRAYPAVQLRLTELVRDEQITAIIGETLDIGFIRGMERPIIPNTLIAVQFLEEDLIVAMRRDHPLAAISGPIHIAMLANEPFVLYQRKIGAGFNEGFDRLCRDAGFEPRVSQEATGLATLLGFVLAGFGLTVLPRSLAALHVADLAYRPLAEPHAISRLWLLHRADRSASSARFLDIACNGDDDPDPIAAI